MPMATCHINPTKNSPSPSSFPPGWGGADHGYGGENTTRPGLRCCLCGTLGHLASAINFGHFCCDPCFTPPKGSKLVPGMGPPYSPTKTGCWNSVIWPEFCTVLNVWFLRHEWRRGSMRPSVSWKRSRRWWGHSGMCWLPIGVRWIELQLWAGFPSAGLDGRLFGFACVKMGTGPLW